MSHPEVYNKTDTMNKVLSELYKDEWSTQGGTVESITWKDEHTTTSEEKKKIEDKFKELEPHTKLDNVRHHRNKLLKNCDWTQTPDVPMTDSKKEEWKKYRQELRDITKTATTMDDAKWPTEPS